MTFMLGHVQGVSLAAVLILVATSLLVGAALLMMNSKER